MIVISILCFLLFQDRPIQITIDPLTGIQDQILLSDYAKKISYIKLETKDNCMVSDVIKLLIDGKDMFIITRYGQFSRLLKFTFDGRFICEIGNQGRGPGEYSTVLDIALDKINKKLYILDTMGKVLCYDYLGNYLNIIELPSRPSSLVSWNNNLIFFSAWPDYYLNNGYGIQVKQLDMKSDIYLLNRKWITGKRGQGVMVYPNYSYGVNANNTVSFFESKFDTLYTINSSFKIRAEMVINLNNKIPYNLLTQNEYTEAYKKHNVLYDILNADNFMFFTVMTPKPMITYFYVLDKTTLQIKKHDVTKDKQYIKNDIDGGLNFRPKGVADKGILYTSFDCYLLKDYISSRDNSALNSDKRAALANIVKNSNLSDNPIIMLVEIK